MLVWFLGAPEMRLLRKIPTDLIEIQRTLSSAKFIGLGLGYSGQPQVPEAIKMESIQRETS
jgi:hypothetical protein